MAINLSHQPFRVWRLTVPDNRSGCTGLDKIKLFPEKVSGQQTAKTYQKPSYGVTFWPLSEETYAEGFCRRLEAAETYYLLETFPGCRLGAAAGPGRAGQLITYWKLSWDVGECLGNCRRGDLTALYL